MFSVSVKNLVHFSRVGWLVLIVSALAVVWVGMVLVSREPEPVPVVLLTRPFSMPLRLRDRIGQWIPRKPAWDWAFRFVDAVFGRRTVVTLTTEILRIPDSTATVMSDFTPGPPDFSNANGLQVWLVPGSELKSLRERFKQIAGTESINRPRISTADGVSASLFSGETALIDGLTNQVGLEVSYFARVRGVGTDLFASVHLTELMTNDWKAPEGLSQALAVQTNMDVAFRLQIPKGSGVFMLSGGSANAVGKRLGVMIDPP